MQKLKTTLVEPASRIEKSIVVGWAVLVFVVIMVAAGLARIIVADISAQESGDAVTARSQTSPDVAADSLAVSDLWIRATPPGARTAAAYLYISNSGDNDRLLEVRSERARIVEIHATQEQSGMMRMSQLDSLAVPADSDLQLGPGGYHLMLVEISDTFVPGDSVLMTLMFEKAGAMDVSFTVRDAR
jgi:copper(I)-binding protein